MSSERNLLILVLLHLDMSLDQNPFGPFIRELLQGYGQGVSSWQHEFGGDIDYESLRVALNRVYLGLLKADPDNFPLPFAHDVGFVFGLLQDKRLSWIVNDGGVDRELRRILVQLEKHSHIVSFDLVDSYLSNVKLESLSEGTKAAFVSLREEVKNAKKSVRRLA